MLLRAEENRSVRGEPGSPVAFTWGRDGRLQII
jgi:hypothetical protein